MKLSITRIESPSLQEAAYTIRTEVFVKEQQVPNELELDEYDDAPETIHIAAQEENGAVIGTARLRPANRESAANGESTAKVERVAVLASHRKNGIGRALMDFLEAEAVKSGFTQLKLNAQTHARDFYEQLGYEAAGSHFFEAGIEHITMYKELQHDSENQGFKGKG